MNRIQYWECKKHKRQAGVLTDEADRPAAAKPAAASKGQGDGAGRSGWKGPGTLWVAEAEDPLRDTE
jgi:hypothetical protein